MTYGQHVLARDSENFGFLMTQNLTYREYLESKWRLMAVSVFLSLILSSFYLLFGWKIYLIIMTTAIYNIGVGSFVNLYSGAFNRVPIKLNVKANTFSITKAFSLTQLLSTIPKLGLPIFIFFIADFIWGRKSRLILAGLFWVIGSCSQTLCTEPFGQNIYPWKAQHHSHIYKKLNPMIRINNLSKKYDDKQVLNIENLIIEKGERFGLVGNNGAGKTMLFNLILDLVKPHTGDIYNKDIPVSESELWKKHT